MSKEEFLRELEEALAGDVPEAVIRDNVSYYGSYLSQEMAKGRSVEEIVSEIGEPFIIAYTVGAMQIQLMGFGDSEEELIFSIEGKKFEPIPPQYLTNAYSYYIEVTATTEGSL